MDKKLGIRPLGARVVIKRLEIRTTKGGIYIPETASNKSQKGTVVAVGEGKMIKDILCKLSVKCGDNVIFGKYSGTEVNIDGQEYLVMKEEDVIGIIE